MHRPTARTRSDWLRKTSTATRRLASSRSCWTQRLRTRRSMSSCMPTPRPRTTRGRTRTTASPTARSFTLVASCETGSIVRLDRTHNGDTVSTQRWATSDIELFNVGYALDPLADGPMTSSPRSPTWPATRCSLPSTGSSWTRSLPRTPTLVFDGVDATGHTVRDRVAVTGPDRSGHPGRTLPRRLGLRPDPTTDCRRNLRRRRRLSLRRRDARSRPETP